MNLYELTSEAERLNAALAAELTDAEWVEVRQAFEDTGAAKIGRASCRERV